MSAETLTVGHASAKIHLARPAAAATAGVVVLHPWWGLNDDVIAFTDRLADAGFAAAAPDLYDGLVATTIEDADRLSTALDEDAADATVLATVDELGAALGDPGIRIGAVGFSMGAAWALWLPAQRREVVASVVYYGSMSGPSLTRARTPVLGHFAETDPYETEEGLADFERTLRTAARPVEIHRYAGTGHWFAEPSRLIGARATRLAGWAAGMTECCHGSTFGSRPRADSGRGRAERSRRPAHPAERPVERGR